MYGLNTSGIRSPYSRTFLGQEKKTRTLRGVDTYLRGLVVLDDAAECTLSRTERTVQHVHVELARLVFVLETASDLKTSALWRLE